ncbi:MAG: hypothetical protein M3O93_01590 [Chloroflexota bacterium]|nr:hypothetical protein [Chloroflexota bacterium]
MPVKESSTDLERRLATLERRLARSEKRTAAESVFWAIVHNIFPEQARTHMKAAGREQLLAARVYLDQWIARLDKGEAAADQRREQIEIK